MFIADLSSDPYFNLAAEEFFLKESDKPVFRLWRNAPCVVVGRHQNIDIEVNRDVAARRGIPILRRLSGGGAVYHDFGNVNYSLISTNPGMHGLNFDELMRPIVAALNLIGVHSKHGTRGDILLDGAKISGSAFYLWRGYLLHHGTLLFDADLEALESLLEVKDDGKPRPKSIRSVRSKVTNIKTACPGQFANVDAFLRVFGKAMGTLLGESFADARSLTDREKSRIEEMAQATYRRSDWNESGRL